MYECGIVIPVYNGFRGDPNSRWFEDAIESALHSNHNNFCVTIVDDGSDDGSLDVAHRHVVKNLTVITYPKNQGVSHALNAGIAATDAEFIATHGSDDLCTPNRLSAQAKLLRDNPNLQMVGCYYWHCAADGSLIEEVTDVKTDPRDIYCTLITGRCKIGAPMFRKSLWEELGGFDETNFPRCAEDFDFFLRCVEKYPNGIAGVPEMLYGYRNSPISITKSPYFRDYWKAIDMSRERRKPNGRPTQSPGATASAS